MASLVGKEATPAVIEIERVRVEFGRQVLLREVSISIAPGETLVLIGPSGHGKSTLLKVMAGLVEPASGVVRIHGKSRSDMTSAEREALSRTMGMLFQKNALFDSLTAAENVAFPMREILRSSEAEIEQAVAYYLEAVGLSHAKDLFPDEISGGMQKRLGIARALALKPAIVFYDDPTAGLDPITSRKIVQLVRELQVKMKTTVVAVTNDMNRASQLADKIAMIVDGELIDCGSPAQTRAHSDLRVQQFIHGSLSGPLTVVT